MNKGNSGKTFCNLTCSEEHKRKIGISGKGLHLGEKHWAYGLNKEDNPNFGKKRTEKTKSLIRQKALERGADQFMKTTEARLMVSERSKGNNNPSKRPEVKEKQRHKALERRKETCPHCGITCSVNVYSRWHGDKCKALFNEVHCRTSYLKHINASLEA